MFRNGFFLDKNIVVTTIVTIWFYKIYPWCLKIVKSNENEKRFK